MPMFFYRSRGIPDGDLVRACSAPSQAPWLQIEAPTFAEARRMLAGASVATKQIYECREALDGGMVAFSLPPRSGGSA